MPAPVVIDYATLHKWLNRGNKGEIHGEIMANIDNLIRMAIMYDDATGTIRHMEGRQHDLGNSIDHLLNDCRELKLKACKTWQCAKRS